MTFFFQNTPAQRTKKAKVRKTSIGNSSLRIYIFQIIEYLNQNYPKISDLRFLKLNGEIYESLPEISASYKSIAATLQLKQHQKDSIERHPYEDRIEEVFRHWDQNAPQLGRGNYPHTWQGLRILLKDSGLDQKGMEFFEFLEKNEEPLVYIHNFN